MSLEELEMEKNRLADIHKEIVALKEKHKDKENKSDLTDNFNYALEYGKLKKLIIDKTGKFNACTDELNEIKNAHEEKNKEAKKNKKPAIPPTEDEKEQIKDLEDSINKLKAELVALEAKKDRFEKNAADYQAFSNLVSTKTSIERTIKEAKEPSLTDTPNNHTSAGQPNVTTPAQSKVMLAAHRGKPDVTYQVDANGKRFALRNNQKSTWIRGDSLTVLPKAPEGDPSLADTEAQSKNNNRFPIDSSVQSTNNDKKDNFLSPENLAKLESLKFNAKDASVVAFKVNKDASENNATVTVSRLKEGGKKENLCEFKIESNRISSAVVTADIAKGMIIAYLTTSDKKMLIKPKDKAAFEIFKETLNSISKNNKFGKMLEQRGCLLKGVNGLEDFVFSSGKSTNENAITPPPKEEKESPTPTTSTSNQTEPLLPEWYVKQLETDTMVDNSTPRIKP